MKTKESWTAVLFLAALAAGTCMLLYGLLPGNAGTGMVRPARADQRHTTPRAAFPVHQAARTGQSIPKPLLSKLSDFLASADSKANHLLDSQHWFIQLYGGTQHILGRTVVEDAADPQYTVVKLPSGALSFTNDELADTETHAQNLARLNRVLAGRGIPLLYLQAPGKLDPAREDSLLPYGVTDSANASADTLLARLAELEVETVDFRQTLAASDIPWEDWFFRTDHHWTPEAAFYCYQALCDRLEAYSKITRTPTGVRTEHFVVPAQYRDPHWFIHETLENAFLGSQGKRVGSLYGGVDDITIWTPRFDTEFEYTVPSQGIARSGPFESSLLFPERVENIDWYNGNPYTLYSGGDYPIAYMKNNANPAGPRVMLLRDSFACTLAPFLALACSELILIDLRYFNDDLLRYIDWLKPDLFFILYTTGTTRMDKMFDFFTTPSDRVSFPQSKLLPAETRLVPALKNIEQ